MSKRAQCLIALAAADVWINVACMCHWSFELGFGGVIFAMAYIALFLVD